VVGLARPILLTLAVIDFVAAVWTQVTLVEAKRKERHIMGLSRHR